MRVQHGQLHYRPSLGCLRDSPHQSRIVAQTRYCSALLCRHIFPQTASHLAGKGYIQCRHWKLFWVADMANSCLWESTRMAHMAGMRFDLRSGRNLVHTVSIWCAVRRPHFLLSTLHTRSQNWKNLPQHSSYRLNGHPMVLCPRCTVRTSPARYWRPCPALCIGHTPHQG